MEQQKSQECQKSRKERKSEVKSLLASLFAFQMATYAMGNYDIEGIGGNENEEEEGN
ncbi:MAG: hypothetical protein MJZ20_05575 [Bacteroidaceae bacterium]|nr:hypothetical protein [Bacteroidaceae bacterium]